MDINIYNRSLNVDNSTAIKELQYNIETNKLRVHFISGSIWDYKNVPPAIFGSLCCATSIGAAFNELVRNKYEGEKFRLEIITKIPPKKIPFKITAH